MNLNNYQFKNNNNLPLSEGQITRTEPDYHVLKRMGYQIVDMHTHSSCSDASCSIEAMMIKARKLGFGFCVCDHNQISGSIKVCNNKDIFSIPSIEITSNDAKDIILYFYSADELIDFYEMNIRQNRNSNIGFNLNRTHLSMPEIIQLSKKCHCLRVIPHPLIKRPKLSYKYFLQHSYLLNDIHNIEVLNATMQHWRNKYSEEFAKQISKPFVGGSDSHNINDLGRVVTIARAETVKEFLDNLKAGKLAIVGLENNLLQGIAHKFVLLKNNIWFSRSNLARSIQQYDYKHFT